MKTLWLGGFGIMLGVALAACGGDSGDGGGSGGGATGGTGGATGGTGGATGGTGGTTSGGGSGGLSGGGGSAGSGASCSVLSWNGCPALLNCMHANCSTQIAECYGANFASDDATGSKCEIIWSCSMTCPCGDDACLVGTCYSQASADCKACIPAISDCMTTNCSAELQGC